MLRIKYILLEKGVPVTEYAKRCGINRTTVNRIVNHVELPSDERKLAMARALGWPEDKADDLFEQLEVNLPDEGGKPLELQRALEQNSRLLHRNVALERENENLKSDVEMLREFASLLYGKYDEITSSMISAAEKLGEEHGVELPDKAFEAARQEMDMVRVMAKLLGIGAGTR